MPYRTGTQPPPPFLPEIDPFRVQRQVRPRAVSPLDPDLGGDLARLIAALTDIRRVNIGGRGARAQRSAEYDALQHLAYGTLPEMGPLTSEQAQFQEQAQRLKREVRVRNVTGRKRGPIAVARKILGAPKEGAPATRRELLKQQESLIRMIQNPEFYKALQENEPSRQMANRSLASRRIYIPSLKEEQAGQARLPSDVQSHLAFYEIGLERAEESDLSGAKAREFARDFADKQRTAYARGAEARVDVEKEKATLREELAAQQHDQRMAEIRLRAELSQKAQAIDQTFRRSMAGSSQRLQAMDLMLELSRDMVNQGLLESMFGDTLQEKIANQFRMWGVSEEAISALGEALAGMAQAEVGAPPPEATPSAEAAPTATPGANPYLVNR